MNGNGGLRAAIFVCAFDPITATFLAAFPQRGIILVIHPMPLFKRIAIGLGLARPVAAGKPGARAYAIGDVHGCIDQLEALLAAIAEDMATAPATPTYIVFLGDLIDRGPDSGGVVDRLLHYRPSGARPVFIKGNHEEFLLRALAGEPGLLHQWLDYGGRECVESYGLRASRLVALDDADAAALLRQFVPESHRRFLDGFSDSFRFGDFVFVHAGIRPGLPLETQQTSDLRWIREPFLSDRANHGFVVVHGHTIVDRVERYANRIAIDTGVYRTGVLSALAIEGDTLRVLSTNGAQVAIAAI